MAQAIYGQRDDEVVMVIEVNGETADEEPFAVRLDVDNPERSVVEFKPGSKSKRRINSDLRDSRKIGM